MTQIRTRRTLGQCLTLGGAEPLCGTICVPPVWDAPGGRECPCSFIEKAQKWYLDLRDQFNYLPNILWEKHIVLTCWFV